MEGIEVLFLATHLVSLDPFRLDVAVAPGAINGWPAAPEFDCLVQPGSKWLTLPRVAVSGMELDTRPPRFPTYPGNRPADISRFEVASQGSIASRSEPRQQGKAPGTAPAFLLSCKGRILWAARALAKAARQPVRTPASKALPPAQPRQFSCPATALPLPRSRRPHCPASPGRSKLRYYCRYKRLEQN